LGQLVLLILLTDIRNPQHLLQELWSTARNWRNACLIFACCSPSWSHLRCKLWSSRPVDLTQNIWTLPMPCLGLSVLARKATRKMGREMRLCLSGPSVLGSTVWVVPWWMHALTHSKQRSNHGEACQPGLARLSAVARPHPPNSQVNWRQA
jgi:hypothetical protein